jgi:hypothetical protein
MGVTREECTMPKTMQQKPMVPRVDHPHEMTTCSPK